MELLSTVAASAKALHRTEPAKKSKGSARQPGAVLSLRAVLDAKP
jgi:hypothetical protein